MTAQAQAQARLTLSMTGPPVAVGFFRRHLTVRVQLQFQREAGKGPQNSAAWDWTRKEKKNEFLETGRWPAKGSQPPDWKDAVEFNRNFQPGKGLGNEKGLVPTSRVMGILDRFRDQKLLRYFCFLSEAPPPEVTANPSAGRRKRAYHRSDDSAIAQFESTKPLKRTLDDIMDANMSAADARDQQYTGLVLAIVEDARELFAEVDLQPFPHASPTASHEEVAKMLMPFAADLIALEPPAGGNAASGALAGFASDTDSLGAGAAGFSF